MGIMKNASAPSTAKRSKDNERPLVEDIRLLGRILGDEIRDQDGVAAFDLIEKIKNNFIQRHIIIQFHAVSFILHIDEDSAFILT